MGERETHTHRRGFGRGGVALIDTNRRFLGRLQSLAPVKAHGPLVGVCRMKDVTSGYSPVRGNGASGWFLPFAPCTSCGIQG